MASNLLYSNDVASEYPDSWYASNVHFPTAYPQLKDQLYCDVCVIGGGFTGLSAAIGLREAGLDVILLDAHRVGWGASGRNGGQLGTGQRVEQDELELQYGQTQAQALWALAQRSKQLVHDLIDRYDIACDYQPGIIHADHKARYTASTERYVEKLNRDYGYSQIEFAASGHTADLLGTDAYYSCAIDTGAGHLHPLKFALGLANAANKAGVRIFESTEVKKISYKKPVELQTDSGNVTARNLIFACNGYLGNLNSDIAKRVMPINNYIIATEPLSVDRCTSLIRNNMAVADSRFVVNYFRKSSDNRLLFGGRESYGYRFPGDIKSFVRKAMVNVYPDLAHSRIDFGWGGTLAITMNRLPHLTSVNDNVYSASGYSGHGVGMATLSGQLLAQTISGDHGGFNIMAGIEHRRFPGGVKLRSPLLKLAMLYYSIRDHF